MYQLDREVHNLVFMPVVFLLLQRKTGFSGIFNLTESQRKDRITVRVTIINFFE